MKDSLKKLAVQYVRSVLDAKGWTATELAERIKVSSTTLTRPLNSEQHPHGLSLKTLLAIQEESGIPLPKGLGNQTLKEAKVSVFPAHPAPAVDLPVRGQAAGARGDAFMMHDHLADTYVERPWFLIGRGSAYALYVFDDSMMPAYQHGHMLYVDPARPASPGDDVVIEMNDGQAFLKRLKRRTASETICEQFNPKKERRFATKDIKSIHLVVASLRVRS